MNSLSKIFKNPIVLLLSISLIIGLFIFRDFGLSWDEPLFYKYADALGYAYTPANWFSGRFDLNNSYGPSGDDHKNRGPAYLFLAREPVYLIQDLGVDNASAWHLINFITFLLGVYFIYRLSERFMRPWAAFAASALFTFQPLLWGHAFINPKDPSFLVFLTASIYLGFRLVDKLADEPAKNHFWDVLLAAFFLGITTSIRIIGPLAGVFVIVYFITRKPTRQTVRWIFLYTVISILIMLATWPYLWENPPLIFLQVLKFMSDNPTGLSVLFNDQIYHPSDLPHRYLPFFLFFTLTEPVWPFFFFGLVAAYRKLRNARQQLVPVLIILAWFVIPFLYVLINRPPMYDGMRHFLFITPPIFIFIGFSFDFVMEKINRIWLNALIILAILAPGIIGIIQLHPYEYTYYNSFIGGTKGVFRHYETDYWLTCYKEAVEQFNQTAAKPVNLYVHREPYIAATYAANGVTIKDGRADFGQIKSGDYVLINSRSNEDIQNFRSAPVVLRVEHAGATFCVIKKIP